ncbi:MAG: DNA polymerase I [Micrococcales bacterium]
MNASEKPTLLLIDGHSLAFRAFYALSPDSFRAPSGQHTNAVHGFISMLLTILQTHKPSHIAVAFDLSRSSFRTEEYPEYKGTRGETPPEFIGQTEVLYQVLEAMNIRTLTRENYEADDVLASLADQGADAGYRVLLVSGDRDTFQLIREETTILYPVKGVLNLANMDDAAVYEKYGVHAKQYPDLAALVGETSDNLPGIPGVGPKTAAKWLQQYGTLQAIFDSANEISGKVGESLREHMQLAVRNRRLNHLIRDLQFDFDFKELKLDGIDVEKVKAVFGELGFRSITEKVLRSKELGAGTAAATAIGSVLDLISAEEPAKPRRDVQVPETKTVTAAELLNWLRQQKQTIGLSLSPEGAGLEVGVASEIEAFSTTLVSSSELAAWLSDASVKKAVFDAKALTRLMLAEEIKVAGFDYDVLVLAYLLNPVKSKYSLVELADEYLDVQIEKPDAGLQAWLALSLSADLHDRVKDEGQLRVYTEIEMPASEVLAQMEFDGVRVNRKLLENLFAETGAEANSIAQQCYELIGHEVNLASPKQLQTVIFEELGLTGTKAVKTGFSTNAAALTELYEQTNEPFLERLLAHREATKIKQMVETLLKAVSSDERIHTSYTQTGTSTGRLSSENPNLQNIPIKSERGRQMREAFIASEGFETLLTADYSQIEMRIMAHLSEDPGLIEAFNTGEDLHRFVGSRLFGVSPAEVTSAMRSKVKAMSYGLVYGLSEYGLAKQLRISNGEAKQLMSDYFARFGGVKRYLASVVDTAKQEGFTVTSYGRRRPFDDLNSKIFQIRENARRAALNAPIQGTAADIMKLAMISVANRMREAQLKSRMLLQVHDELVFEVAPGELEQLKTLVVEAMSTAAVLSVPLEVHVGIGQNWDAAGH